MLLHLLAACHAPTAPLETPTDTTDPSDGCGVEGGVVTVETDDGVILEADYQPAATCGAPAVILLHMVPPAWDRTSWPRPFRTQLVEAGFTVFNLDRRGAGGSGGEPEDAYGPPGWMDVAAAARRLERDGWGDLSILGASNGTASMIDYTIRAEAEGLPQPVALGFLTGGEYTEAQHPMTDLPPVPAVFTFSTEERAWSVAQQPLDPGTWTFLEYPEGDHGTLMFEAAPEVADDLLTFLAAPERRRR